MPLSGDGTAGHRGSTLRLPDRGGSNATGASQWTGAALRWVENLQSAGHSSCPKCATARHLGALSAFYYCT
jgi:hypothetical protein